MDQKLISIVDADVSALIKSDPAQLYNLIELLGSPLHITFPGIMQATARRYRDTLDAWGMSGGKIHFAAKANKANSFLAASAIENICVDASSVQELTAALSAGVPGSAIGVSGPAKPLALLALAMLHGAYIAVDDPHELDSIIRLTKSLPLAGPVYIYLRLCASSDSRFGMTADVLTQLLPKLVPLQDTLRLDGFSFHVSGYGSQDRVHMISRACELVEQAYDIGLKPVHINIGGGLQVTYAKESDWSLQRATEREFAGGISPQFIYPYTGGPSGYAQLKEILQLAKPSIDKTQSVIGAKIMIDLEPGRSLLDQAGISVFRVQGVRPIGKRWLVMVDGNSRSLAEFWRNSEFLLDPIHVTNSPRNNESFAAAIASNTCLESDYLARRFIPFESRPVPGDLLVFVNTAGYQMDSKESEFHRLPLASKVAAVKRGHEWHFISDSRISVADLLADHAKSKQK